jgi:hypothetical protein
LTIRADGDGADDNFCCCCSFWWWRTWYSLNLVVATIPVVRDPSCCLRQLLLSSIWLLVADVVVVDLAGCCGRGGGQSVPMVMVTMTTAVVVFVFVFGGGGGGRGVR